MYGNILQLCFIVHKKRFVSLLFVRIERPQYVSMFPILFSHCRSMVARQSCVLVQEFYYIIIIFGFGVNK